MRVREVQSDDNVRWQCAEAIGDSSAADKCIVVCTPSGGEQTVRLQLDGNWFEQVADKDLVAAINRERY